MARREPSPLLGASESGDLADVARRDLMVPWRTATQGPEQLASSTGRCQDAEAQRTGSMSPV
jgi:hypothetical protein